MAKIGDELYIESLCDELVFRAVNAAESAYCMIVFNKSFFTYYNNKPQKNADDNDLKCKISMKSALIVFKSPGQMDKQVEICEIRLDSQGEKLVFQLRCKHGIVKTHFVSILDGKRMEASYSKEMPNRLVVHHRVFGDAVGNFQNSEDQITFEVNPETIHIRNYVSANIDLTKLTRTQLSLKPLEFESYTIGVNSCVTFSMKEFRAFLMFAEAMNLSITIAFDTCGKPIVLVLSNNSTFEANLVLATEKADNITQMSEQISTTMNVSKRRRIDTNVEIDVSKRNKDPDADLFNFVKETSRLTEVEDDDLDLMESACEEAERSLSPIIYSQTSKIKTIFRRCFDATLDPSKMNRSLNILADESDCD